MPSLTALFFGEIGQEENEISWIENCDMTPLLDAYPKLELFRLRGATNLGFVKAKHKTLRALGVESRARFYNNLKLRVYHREKEIRPAIEFLCRETAHVEQWLPKAHQLGRNFDLRIVAIDGQPRHIVVRTSLSPLTNCRD